MSSFPSASQPAASASLSDSDSDSEDGYVGWRPQLTTVQQAAQAPPLSPLDLAMYPGAPAEADPETARKAVAGLRPLRILSSRRPGGPASAGPSRPPSTASTPGSSSAARSGFISLLSAAKRASAIVVSSQTSSSSSSPRTTPQSLSISHAPIPVSPLPPPRTPPLIPTLRIAPELSDQMEPALRAYLESLASQAASASSAQASPPRRGSSSQAPDPGPIGLTDEEKIMLGIRDLDAEQASQNPVSDVVNRESQSTSQRSPSISEFMVVRDLDAQPRTPLPIPIVQTPRPLTPSPPQSPTLLSPILLVPNARQSRQLSPVTPCTEAANVNRNLELSLYDLERALGRNPQSLSHSRPRLHSQSDSVSTYSPSLGSRPSVYTPRTARTTSSHVFSVFSSRTTGTPLTTPPASPPPLPRPFAKQPVDLPSRDVVTSFAKAASKVGAHVRFAGRMSKTTI
ncbi:hypothetical protein RhiJN_22028 [Ceratobasidium sp. AG-Ba]|nr:hypothetical protein RhiJN_22028 [Ceratobasidium sp. AG-Ba]